MHVARVITQLLDRPVLGRHADDRAVQQTAPLEAIERVEGHHLGEVAGDAEDDEDVGGLRLATSLGSDVCGRGRMAVLIMGLGVGGRDADPEILPARSRARIIRSV